MKGVSIRSSCVRRPLDFYRAGFFRTSKTPDVRQRYAGDTRSVTGFLLLLLILLVVRPAFAGPEDPQEGGQWSAPIDWPHIAVSGANLPDGRILTWSGSERETWPTTEQTYSATWNPQTNEFIEVLHAGHNMFCAHLAMMEDGRVFVNGGRNQTNSPWTSLFDYRDDEWVQIENMASGGRWYPTTVALADGDIFTAIGTATLAKYPERWDPDTGWQIQNGIDFDAMVLDDYFTTNSHGESRWWPLLHVAPSGELFHSGPTPKMHLINTDGNGSYAQTGGEFNDWYHKHGATIMYDEGKILTAGGWIAGDNGTSTNKAFTVDLNGPSPSIAIIGSMNHARKFQSGVMLPTGEVLIVGGNTSGQKFSDNGAILIPEIWSPATGQWREVAAMAVPRNYHSIALLTIDGRVLAAGGGYCSNSIDCNGASHRDGEVYTPSYLFDANDNLATRPTINSSPGKVNGGQTFNLSATPGIDYFSLIKMSAVSHGVNTDVRFLKVPFTETSSGQYELTMHENQNVLTPGYWMLFAIDQAGVPSVAQVLQINTAGLPWIKMISNRTDASGSFVSLQVVANDADNDPVIYSATGLPTGLAINAGTGLISGTAQSEGTFNVSVTVADNDEGSRNRSFDWTIHSAGLGSITRDWWEGLPGSAITDMTGNPAYPDSPTGSELIDSLEGPVDWAEEYGSRVYGFITPQISGLHTFWISTDDSGELWLSSNDQPDNKALIANVPEWSNSREWFKFPEQQSAAIFLQAGQKYYIEALQKEGGGGDNVAVGWAQPGESMPTVIDGQYLSPYVELVDPPAQLEVGLLSDVGSDWQSVPLAKTYANMVVVATPQYGGIMLPAVTRVRNATGNTFEVKVQNPSGNALSGYTVHYVVTEAGRFENAGAAMEAVKFNSTVTDNDQSWVGEPRIYQASYTSPVVLGQVMTANDDDWSAFWSSNGTQADPPDVGSLSVGKHVGEDLDTTRTAETIGYIVIESGSGMFGDLEYQAGVGADTVPGFDGVTSYPLTTPANAAILSAAAMDGANGGWPILKEPSPLGGNAMAISFDEDMIEDAERTHTDEQVAYLAITGSINVTFEVQTVVSTPAVSGAQINYAVDTNVDFLLFKWNFGDGTGETVYTDDPSISHAFSGPGRYVVVLTIQNPYTLEETTQTFVQLVHAPLTASAPAASSTLALHPLQNQLWNVNPDNNTVTVIDTVANLKVAEIQTGNHPAALAIAPDGNVWVSNKADATISVIDTVLQTVITTYALPLNSRPHGIVFNQASGEAFVALEATGVVLAMDAATGVVNASAFVATNARHLSINGDGTRLLVSQFVTPPLPDEATATPIVESGGVFYGGEVNELSTNDLSVLSTYILQHSDRFVSEHSGPGIPNYLGPAVISPDGLSAWVPSKQDNILAGSLRGGQGMTFDQTVRAITSKLDLVSGTESFAARIDHDNAGLGSNAAFGPYGAHLFTTLETNREVVISDAYSATEMLRFDVGRAPQGIALSADGNTLYVHNFMDRTVGVYDVSSVIHDGMLDVVELAVIDTVSAETLSPQILLGKQHFYDARDPRLAGDSYMSCASCHNEGKEDGRVWDFTGVGEGLRNTITLAGRSGMNHGFLHWSANFDEGQDFEGQIRNFAGGTGLMDDASFMAGTRSEPLGDPKSGLSADLDALAAYMGSLSEADPSPYAVAAGQLSAQGELGRQAFASAGCIDCHTPPRYTDSALANLHDVGTMTSASGLRLGGVLDGIDTPSLISVWQSAPYLHDGSAFDLNEAIVAHDGISLDVTEQQQIETYLLELDASTATLLDSDSDGVYDHLDNCTLVNNPAQIDSDNDGYGNQCDADINNDCLVNFLDLGLFQNEFLIAGDTPADFNADGVVNFLDMPRFVAAFMIAPGPSGTTQSCSSN